jgi:hypothetical protein
MTTAILTHSAPPRRPSQTVPGVDFMVLAQRELFGRRSYKQLTRAQCGAVRRRALELLSAHRRAAAAALSGVTA